MLLSADGLSPAVRLAFERVSDLDNYTPQQLQTTPSWVVRLAEGRTVEQLAGDLGVGLAALQPTQLIANTYFFDATMGVIDPTGSSGNAAQLLQGAEGVEYFYPLVARQQSKRLIPNDPLFADQWHLRNTGQSGGTAGADANITSVWDSFTGTGAVIGVVDDGLQHAHPDLTARYQAALSFDFNDNDADPTPTSPFDGHGTSAAGVAAATANNNVGGSGSAPGAGLAGLRLIAGPTDDALEANALGFMRSDIDIYSNSWGPSDIAILEAPGPLTLAALEDNATAGRNGLGNIYTWAAGNGLENNDNVNYDGYANSRFTIAVAAVDHNGVQSYYSEPGAAILVTAYSNGDDVGITTTDLVGAAGYAPTDYTDDFGGTSSAAPLVSGVIALMLQANPNLTYRDVQHILVQTARQNHASDTDWITNGGGHMVDHKYGFGAIDAQAAVTAAQGWTTVAAEISASSALTTVGTAIPDNDATGVESTITITDALTLEWVEIVFHAQHTVRGDLEVVLTSPDGTQSILAQAHGSQDSGAYSSWLFTSARNWGESSAGEWKLSVRDRAAGNTGTFTSWQLHLYGTAGEGPTGSVAGAVWQDDDGDGVRDAAEAGIAGWTVYADLNNNGSREGGEPSTTTTAEGTYTLTDVGVGTRTIAQVVPSGWNSTFPTGGTHSVSVTEGNTTTGIDFGNRPQPGEIRGLKWNDVDADGALDSEERTVAGWTIYLDLNGNGTLDAGEPSDTTDEEGQYVITVLEPDTYIVAEVMVAGVPQTFPGGSGRHLITVGAGQIVEDVNFGNNLGPTGIFGRVWHDANGNALRETGENYLAGMTVYLDLDGDQLIGLNEPVSVTDAQGRYGFPNLGGGTYAVRLGPSPGWLVSTPAGGAEFVELADGDRRDDVNFALRENFDFGDAPAPYPTTIARSGAVHGILPGFHLGGGVDGEPDGLPHASGLGDDLNGLDDEDGVRFVSALIPGRTTTLWVTASQTGLLNAWIDFNTNGSWDDPGERVFTNRALTAGENFLFFQVPASVLDGVTLARFRYSHQPSLGPAGPAVDGEVEDYAVVIGQGGGLTPPPTAVDDEFLAEQDSDPLPLNVLANDVAFLGALVISAVGPTSDGGTVEIVGQGASLLYTPAEGFVGTETFTYTVSDTLNRTDTATVTVQVQLPTGSGPAAVDDMFDVTAGSNGNVLDVLANDAAAIPGGLTIIDVSPTSHGGTVAISNDGGQLTYTPAATFVGGETFTYTVEDANGATDEATVTVNVTASAANDLVRIRLRATDASGAPLTTVVSGVDFQLRAYVEDLRAVPQGVFAAYLDVLYDSARSSVTGSLAPSSTYNNSLSGSTTTSGLVDEVGGAGSLTPTGGGELLLVTIPMRGIVVGQASFTAEPADILPLHDILLYGSNTPVASADVDYVGTTVEVVSLTNTLNPLDVNRDTVVSPIDALLVLNELNGRGPRALSGSLPRSELPRDSVDVDANGVLSPFDSLLVINELNRLAALGRTQALSGSEPAVGEGESLDAGADLDVVAGAAPTVQLIESAAPLAATGLVDSAPRLASPAGKTTTVADAPAGAKAATRTEPWRASVRTRLERLRAVITAAHETRPTALDLETTLGEIASDIARTTRGRVGL